MIVYMVGYSWTWDLDGTGKTAQQYRQVLIRLFEPFGFQEFQTNEPNICLKPENLFMGRVGRHVSASVQHNFKWLRFGITP
jgi:acetoin utilization protein AcuA